MGLVTSNAAAIEIADPPPGLPIVPVDDETKACMADEACMLDYFLKMTLGNDYERIWPGEGEPRLTKAVGPVRVGVAPQEDLSAERVQTAIRVLEDTIAVARAAGADLHAWERDPVVPANMAIFISDDFARDRDGTFADLIPSFFIGGVDDYERRRSRIEQHEAACLGVVFFPVQAAGLLSARDVIGGFQRGAALIPSDLSPNHYIDCLFEETIQALGLMNDFKGNVSSTFKDEIDGPRLGTAFDFLLLRILYHPRIKPYMNADDIKRVFPETYRSVISSPPYCLNFDDCLQTEISHGSDQ